MLTSSSNERERGFRSKTSQTLQASAETLSLELNAPSETSALTSSIDSLPPSAHRLTPSLSHLESIAETMPKSAAGQKRQTKSSSTRIPSLMPSMKQPGEKSPDIAEPADQRPWNVEFHREVAKTVAKHGGEEAPAFTPTIRGLKDALANDPKQFPKKQGKLKEARATHVRFGAGVEWVAVFQVLRKRERSEFSHLVRTIKPIRMPSSASSSGQPKTAGGASTSPRSRLASAIIASRVCSNRSIAYGLHGLS